jgi:hypothetical protein
MGGAGAAGDAEVGRLPAELLEAIADPRRGRITVVTGAGTSVEAPTGLPMARELAQESHRRLIEDGVIIDGSCRNPEDLSSVADAVFLATGSQRMLVERFLPDRFRNASPNEGHLRTAALFCEGAIRSVLTLNFDMAQRTALADLGGRDVALIRGPEDHARMAMKSLVFLHRSIDADPDELILRSESLEEAWRGGWEEVVVQAVAGTSVVVFVGLGTPSAVLVETTRHIMRALGSEAEHIYVVDVSPPSESAFLAALGLPEENYVRLPWSSFTEALDVRVVAEQLADIKRHIAQILADNGWNVDNTEDVIGAMGDLGVVKLGRLRAKWLMQKEGAYATGDDVALGHMADLLLGWAYIERETGARAFFGEDGVVELELEGTPRMAALAFSGRGLSRWATMVVKATERAHALGRRRPPPRVVLLSGVMGGEGVIAPPQDLVGGDEDNVAVGVIDEVEVVSVDSLMSRGVPAAIFGGA